MPLRLSMRFAGLILAAVAAVGLSGLWDRRDGDGWPHAPACSKLPSPAASLSGISFDGESLWVTPYPGGKVLRMDPATGTVLGSFPYEVRETGGSAWDGSHLWQLAYADKVIHRIDPRTGRRVGSIPSPGRGLCSGMTFDGSALWVANFEDRRVYRIDPERGGRELDSMPCDFETTGLAWDGRSLWNGVLVGAEEHDGPTPFTGFVQERRPGHAEDVGLVFPVAGVGPGTSDWTPGSGRARRFWWYDGFHNQIVAFNLGASAHASPRGLTAVALAIGMVLTATSFAPARPRGRALHRPDSSGADVEGEDGD